MKLEMEKVALPPATLRQAKPLLGFDKGEHLFHVLAFDFGDDGGAIGVWREGDDFCARITLDALAAFADAAKAEHVAKGDPRDVGNFAMFLHQRGEAILPPREAAQEPVIPRCPSCGYTNEDCRTLMDHHLCGLPDPPPPQRREGSPLRLVTDEDIERVAQTLWDSAPSGHKLIAKAGYPIDWPSQAEGTKRDYRKLARAAIECDRSRLTGEGA